MLHTKLQKTQATVIMIVTVVYLHLVLIATTRTIFQPITTSIIKPNYLSSVLITCPPKEVEAVIHS